MKCFKEYIRIQEIEQILENNLFYQKDFMKSWERSHPEPVKLFFDKLGANLRAIAGKGLEMINSKSWSLITSKIKSLAGDAYTQIPEAEKASEEEVKLAFDQLKEYRKKTSFEEMRMYLSILNKVIKTNLSTTSVENQAYYNALRSLIENPSRFMTLNTPQGGWNHVMKPVAQALTGLSAPEVASIVSQSVAGSPEASVVSQAIKKTLDDMSDTEIRSIVWADRRFKKGRETTSKVLEPYGIDHSDLSLELEKSPQLRRRFRLARRQKSEFKKRED